MREIVALIRAGWLTAASYRISLLVSLTAFLVSFIPIFFVADALQPVVQNSIQAESSEYFTFLVLGLGLFTVVTAAATTLPTAIASSISSGTFEAFVSTPTPMHRIVAGMSGYALLWSLARAVLLLIGAALIGAQISWGGLPVAVLVVALAVLAYGAVALVASALVLAFRTAGPLVIATLTASALLGGVYYSAAAIPSWLQSLSAAVPLTYAARALRRVLLTGASVADVSGDLAALALFAVALTAFGGWSFALALRYSRRAGTLAQY